ncbi:SHISA5 isoform 9 [Pan troglodytes]|uniref:Shisa family member 5 n=2 Tax=Homininae TaxID=207598 RepID=F8WDS1_HUMAN|nr:SHISA5 isoform 9 [Pan troglodytes]
MTAPVPAPRILLPLLLLLLLTPPPGALAQRLRLGCEDLAAYGFT